MGIMRYSNKLSPEAAASVIKTKLICNAISRMAAAASVAIVLSSFTWAYIAHCAKTLSESNKYRQACTPNYKEYSRGNN